MGNQDGELRLRTKTKNGERRIRKDKDGEKERVKKVYPVSAFKKRVEKVKKVYPTSEPFPKKFTRFPRHINPVSENCFINLCGSEGVNPLSNNNLCGSEGVKPLSNNNVFNVVTTIAKFKVPQSIS